MNSSLKFRHLYARFTPMPNVSDDLFFTHFSAADAPFLKAALALLPEHDKAYPRPSSKQVAHILLGLRVNLSTIIATLLSDPRLQNQLSESAIIRDFGSQVADLVKDVHWLNSINVYSLEMANQPEQYEILRRMLLSMTHNAHAVIIKLAYRLQRLRELRRESVEMRHFVAHETLDIYAPIANRLGVSQIKWELEDLAFRYLNPAVYAEIAHSLAANRKQRQTSIDQFIDHLQQHLLAAGITAQLFGRPKHIYSIWKKMQAKHLTIEQLYDLLAVRVIVDKLATCYETLGIVHSHWQLIPKEFDDYIANPKSNGYQSLHTIVLDSKANRIEVQIRTQAMDEFAEYGVAAHWLYKEGGQHHAATQKSITAIRQLLIKKDQESASLPTSDERDEHALESFKTSLFYDRVYVLTPKGMLMDLVKGSTPLDFAYAIHTDIGHGCRGAKVNGRIVNLTYTLQSGDQIEILTTKQGVPNRNWLDANLGYLKSPHSISKVKSWFKQQQNEQNKLLGKAILDKEAQRLSLPTLPLKELCKAFNEPDSNKLLIAIGRGDITNRQIASKLSIPELKLPPKPASKASGGNSTILVEGIANVMTTLAHCCNPIPGDVIKGFITHAKGITIHRQNCINLAQHYTEHPEQIVAVSWQDAPALFPVPVTIHASQNDELLQQVAQVLSQNKAGFQQAELKVKEDFSCVLNVTITISNIKQLSKILAIFNELPHVFDVKRKTNANN